MTTTASFTVRDRTDLFDTVAAPRPARNWFRRAIRRIRLQVAVAQVRTDLLRMPDYVLRDIDIHYAVYSATRVLVRRALARKTGGRPWTS